MYVYLICKTMRKQRNCTESDVNFIVHQFFITCYVIKVCPECPWFCPQNQGKCISESTHFQNFLGGHAPESPLGIASQRHARVGLQPKYLPTIARFPPVKNLSYIPAFIRAYKQRGLSLRGLNIIGLEKSALKQAVAVLTKIPFAFTGFELGFKTS